MWSVALYEAETWTMTQTGRERLAAFEMWVWRTLKSKLDDDQSNQQRSSSKSIRKTEYARYRPTVQAKIDWIGHSS